MHEVTEHVARRAAVAAAGGTALAIHEKISRFRMHQYARYKDLSLFKFIFKRSLHFRISLFINVIIVFIFIFILKCFLYFRTKWVDDMTNFEFGKVLIWNQTGSGDRTVPPPYTIVCCTTNCNQQPAANDPTVIHLVSALGRFEWPIQAAYALRTSTQS